MLYAIVAIDRPGRLDLRLKTRAKHLAYLAKSKKKVRAAGAFTDEAGAPVGSLIIVECKTLAEADKLIAGDPYSKAGVFESVSVRPWKHTVGTGLPELEAV
jgi:uncharacterized protein YciI